METLPYIRALSLTEAQATVRVDMKWADHGSRWAPVSTDRGFHDLVVGSDQTF